MNEIKLNIDTLHGFHPPKVVIQENGKTLIDMPGDELIGLLKLWMRQHDAAHKMFRED